MALDKSEVSAKGKLLLGGALESALEIELRGKYHNYIEHREKTSFPRGRIEIGKTIQAELLTGSSASSGNTNARS